MSWKNVTTFYRKESKQLKNVLKKRYGLSGKNVDNCKMSSKSMTVLLEKMKHCKVSSKSVTVLPEWKSKSEYCLQKALRSFWKKCKLKNVLKKHYSSFGKKWNIVMCFQKALRSFWNKSEKVKNFFNKRYFIPSRKSKQLKNFLKKHDSSFEKKWNTVKCP